MLRFCDTEFNLDSVFIHSRESLVQLPKCKILIILYSLELSFKYVESNESHIDSNFILKFCLLIKESVAYKYFLIICIMNFGSKYIASWF